MGFREVVNSTDVSWNKYLPFINLYSPIEFDYLFPMKFSQFFEKKCGWKRKQNKLVTQTNIAKNAPWHLQ